MTTSACERTTPGTKPSPAGAAGAGKNSLVLRAAGSLTPSAIKAVQESHPFSPACELPPGKSMTHLLTRIQYWTGVLSGRRTAQNPAHERYRRISQTLVSALMSRGVNVAVGLLSVPLTVKYLGGERY